MFKKMGYSKILDDLQEVCIHPGNRIRTFFSHHDQTMIHQIERDRQSDKRIQGKNLTFFSLISCYLPVTVVEECQKRLSKLSSSRSD